MPIVLPHPIKSDSIAIYGQMIGIRKMRYRLPMLQTVDMLPTDMEFKEQALIGHSSTFSESPSKAETLVITNE